MSEEIDAETRAIFADQERILRDRTQDSLERGITGDWENGLPLRGAPRSQAQQAFDKRAARIEAKAEAKESPVERAVRVTRKWVDDNQFSQAIDDQSLVDLVTQTFRTEQDLRKAQQLVFAEITRRAQDLLPKGL